MVENLTYEEKIECIVSALATPIFRRKINDETLNKLIADVYFEMKERECSSSSGGSIPAGPKAPEIYRQRYDDSLI